MESIKSSAEKIIAYPDPFCTKLRKTIAKYYNIETSNIICGNGAADLIFGFVLAVNPKKALVVSPTFCEYENALNTVDCEVLHYNLDENNGFDLTENFTESITNEIDLVFICNPNNPTGRLYNISVIKKIADKCKETGTLLFLDECFFDLTGERNSAVSIIDNSNMFILKAFTKSYGMAGVRLGYLLSSNYELICKMSEKMQSWNVSTIAQDAGVTALSLCGEHIQKSIQIIKDQRKYLEKELTSLGIEYFSSKVNFILFKADVSLYQKLLDKEILIRKCSNFLGLNENFYRIAVKNEHENKEFIKVLSEVITHGK